MAELNGEFKKKEARYRKRFSRFYRTMDRIYAGHLEDRKSRTSSKLFFGGDALFTPKEVELKRRMKKRLDDLATKLGLTAEQRKEFERGVDK